MWLKLNKDCTWLYVGVALLKQMNASDFSHIK